MKSSLSMKSNQLFFCVYSLNNVIRNILDTWKKNGRLFFGSLKK